MIKNGSTLLNCACCNRRGDSINETYFRTISACQSYNLDVLNNSPRKRNDRLIDIGIFIFVLTFN